MSIHEPNEKHMQKVSIITPCYNAEAFIETTYNCLKAQTYQNWEWIVVDDQSSDSSWEILSNIVSKDKRVITYKNTQNLGAADTRNKCLELATGDFLAFLDCDDLWSADKLKRQIHFMQKNNCDYSYHNYKMINESGDELKQISLRDIVNVSELLKNNPFATSSIIIKSSIIKNNHIKFPSHLRRRQDYIFWYQALKVCEKAYNVGDTLSSYRVFSKNSLSANKKKMALIQWQLYRNEFKLGLLKSWYYFFHYAIHGIKKYFL